MSVRQKYKSNNIKKDEVKHMQHTIFGLIALYTAAAAYITGAVLNAIKEIKEAIDLGLLSDWHFE